MQNEILMSMKFRIRESCVNAVLDYFLYFLFGSNVKKNPLCLSQLLKLLLPSAYFQGAM